MCSQSDISSQDNYNYFDPWYGLTSQSIWVRIVVAFYHTCIIAAYQEPARKHVISFHGVFSFIAVRTFVVFTKNNTNGTLCISST